MSKVRIPSLYISSSKTGWQYFTLNSQCCQLSPTAELYLTGFSFLMFNTSLESFLFLVLHSYRYARLTLSRTRFKSLLFISLFSVQKNLSVEVDYPLVKEQMELWIKMVRKKNIEKELEKFKGQLARKIKIEKMIFFGSL